MSIFSAALKRRCAAGFVLGTLATLRRFACFFLSCFWGLWGALGGLRAPSWESWVPPGPPLGGRLGAFWGPWGSPGAARGVGGGVLYVYSKGTIAIHRASSPLLIYAVARDRLCERDYCVQGL